MNTAYDWITLAIFAGLIVLFLQRSMGEGEARDSIWQYFGAMIGCAVANYLGNKGVETGDLVYHAAAVAAVVGTAAYVYFYLKPFDRSGSA